MDNHIAAEAAIGVGIFLIILGLVGFVLFNFLIPILRISDSSILDNIKFIFLLILAVPLSMILTNVVAWTMPSIRRIENKNSLGVPGASFREANSGLIKLSLLLILVLVILFVI